MAVEYGGDGEEGGYEGEEEEGGYEGCCTRHSVHIHLMMMVEVLQ